MIKSIDATELKKKLDNNDQIILIDCREQQEWDEGHIKEAEFMPLSNWENEYSKYEDAKDKEIILQCRSGKRSMTLANHLEAKGFTNLTNLEGGILGWVESGNPVVED